MALRVLEFRLRMSAVAKRLIAGLSAAAQRYPVANLIFKAILRDHGNSAAQPDRSAALLHRVFDKAYRNRQLWLDRLFRLLVPGNEAPGWTISHLSNEHFAYGGIIGALDLVPDLSGGVAESTESAEIF